MWLSEPQNLPLFPDLSLAPKVPWLKVDDLHLFCFPKVSFDEVEIEAFYRDVLPEEERERAHGITHPENRRAFIQSRALLRWLLGHQLGIPALEVPLVIGPYGKPHHRDHQIAFNLSHTKGVILIGMAKGTELGVDVEQLRPTRRLDALIQEVFAPSEQGQFEGRTALERQTLFLRSWTLKEAWVKASGRGIAAGLSKVVIREDFQGFKELPEADPRDYQVFEAAYSTTRIALVHRGDARKILYYQGRFER